MSKSLILSMEIPFISDTFSFKSYKITSRAQNARPCINAAFAMEIDTVDQFSVMGSPTFVIGGGNTRPMLCSTTAAYFEGKGLLVNSTLQGAMQALQKEMEVSPSSGDSYKISVAKGLLYKFYLTCIGSSNSGSAVLDRPLSHGSQSFEESTSNFPVGVPVHKLEAKLQSSGETQYTTDMPLLPNELSAAFVLTTRSNVDILKIDTSSAEQMPGFIKLITARDIPPPGTNNIISPNSSQQPEELLADKRSEYAGQAAALVLADSPHNAEKIVKAVSIEYGEPSGPPIVHTEDAVRKKAFFDKPEYTVLCGDAKNAIAGSDMSVHGQIECGSQYHFTMETQTALVVPDEDGYTVYSSTQWVSGIQAAVANVLGVPVNIVDVIVKRVGGAYGAKITRGKMVAAACALAACITRRPVRMHMDLETNMKMVGKRFPYLATYQVGFSKQGVVNGVCLDIYANSGINPNDECTYCLPDSIDNAYHVANWDVKTKLCRTNMASNVACRAPGMLPAIFIMESIMDHVAMALDMDVDSVKQKNLYKQGQLTPTGKELKYCQISSLWDQLYKSADVAARKTEIATFNKKNRWMKRGLSVVPIKFNLIMTGVFYPVLVSVYAEDGTVAISHGGVEIGQGINTKVAQVAALTLGISLDKIKLKPCSTVTSANTTVTGGSITSESVCMGTIKACQILNDRIKPVRDENPDLSWKELIAKCFKQSVDLSAMASESGNGVGLAEYYNTYGVTATEIELDVLTGQVQISRVDILYDCGSSMNPEIDIGQVEGAFVMGLGYWLTEEITFDDKSGEVSSCNTWLYKPPSSKDIPIDFRVELLRNAPNPVGVLKSKAAGEPPLCMSCSALFAVKRAVEDARKDAGNTEVFTMSGPATTEKVHNTCLVDSANFSL